MENINLKYKFETQYKYGPRVLVLSLEEYHDQGTTELSSISIPLWELKSELESVNNDADE